MLQRARAKLRPAARSALVLPAKSQSGFIEEIDHEIWEIQRLTVQKRTNEFIPVFDESESLVNRYILQLEARNISNFFL